MLKIVTIFLTLINFAISDDSTRINDMSTPEYAQTLPDSKYHGRWCDYERDIVWNINPDGTSVFEFQAQGQTVRFFSDFQISSENGLLAMIPTGHQTGDLPIRTYSAIDITIFKIQNERLVPFSNLPVDFDWQTRNENALRLLDRTKNTNRSTYERCDQFNGV